MFERVARRFLRGFAMGALASFGTMGVFVGGTFNEAIQWVSLAMVSAFIGGLTGGLLAIDKYLRDKE